jgi:hypothetical protein
MQGWTAQFVIRDEDGRGLSPTGIHTYYESSDRAVEMALSFAETVIDGDLTVPELEPAGVPRELSGQQSDDGGWGRSSSSAPCSASSSSRMPRSAKRHVVNCRRPPRQRRCYGKPPEAGGQPSMCR